MTTNRIKGAVPQRLEYLLRIAIYLTRLEDIFGQGLSWTPLAGSSATAWETSAFHMQWTGNGESEVELRRLWEARKGHWSRFEHCSHNRRRF